MTVDEVRALDVASACADDAVLFLWAASPKLVEALSVMGAWGFRYRTCAVWVKDRIGMGYYFRQQHELILVGARGRLPVPLPSERIGSVIRAPRGRQHSAKPRALQDWIDAAYPDVVRLELFARTRRPGWLAWGDEAGAGLMAAVSK
jgi:N6-adenosine-specific RNA methylase IME4